MEIAFCKALNDRRLKVVLLLHGTKSEQRLIRKEFARPPIFVADFKFEVSKSQHIEVSN